MVQVRRWSLCSSHLNLLVIPRIDSANGRCSFSYIGPLIWNSPPPSIRTLNSYLSPFCFQKSFLSTLVSSLSSSSSLLTLTSDFPQTPQIPSHSFVSSLSWEDGHWAGRWGTLLVCPDEGMKPMLNLAVNLKLKVNGNFGNQNPTGNSTRIRWGN